ncbi:MAG TPA: carboxylesterase/lipase family protein [Candidatus Binataceae bacterium]|nr:carboxylesterase/lipase family protein [Candidatus Binataceae bacterium]
MGAASVREGAAQPIVDTSFGRVRGRTLGGVHIFKGIPYAAPPVGANRFQPPRKPAPWTGVKDTFDFGDRAVQDDNAFALPPELLKIFSVAEPLKMSEDCLVLNVWTPALDGRKRPVMFWCHGGAFIAGSGSSPWYEGTSLARSGDVVVVTINHRLGAFGYLHLEDLCGERFASSGVAGMLDIVAGLEWVRDNIARFGGDAGNVTIFGESGGGAKVCVLMAMPAARGLFHKAIIQSGPGVEMMSREGASETASRVCAELDLKPTEGDRLLSAPAEQLAAAQAAVLKKISLMSFADRRRVGFNPVIDGKNLPGGPFAPAAPAISANIPLMIGTNKDEMTLFFAFAPWLKALDEKSLVERAGMFVGERGAALIAAYRRIRPGDSPRDLMLALTTDAAMRIPSLVIAERKVAQKAAPVFVYLFTFETPVLNGALKSPHALEIPFVFGTLETAPFTGESPDRYTLSDRMMRTWLQFARSGNPNNAAIPEWPTYSPERRATMIFDRECGIQNDPYGKERQAWS